MRRHRSGSDWFDRIALAIIIAVLLAVGFYCDYCCEQYEQCRGCTVTVTVFERIESVTPAPIVSHPYERIVCETVNGTVTCRTYPPGFGGG